MNAFLASLPIGRIPGVGKVTESRLKEIGATTVGRLQCIDQSLLEARFGRHGRRLYDLARGIDHNPVVANRPTKSSSAEDTLERDVSLSETDGWIQGDNRPLCLPHSNTVVALKLRFIRGGSETPVAD